MSITIASEKEKKRFLRTIAEKASKQRHPHSIMFELTYRCNFRCPHCYIPDKSGQRQELGTKQVFAILDELKDMGVFSIGFTGGEALLRKDIFAILEYASGLGFQVGLLSNGYLIDEKTTQKLKAAKIFEVDITFNAMSPGTFAKLTKVEDSFERVKRAVESLKAGKIQVTLKTTCMAMNRMEITQVDEFARALGILHLIDSEILPTRKGDSSWVEKESIGSAEYEALRKKVYPEMFAGNRPPAKPRKKMKRLFNCGAGKNSFSINPYGEMNFCLEIDYPAHNILEMGAKSGWERLKKEIDRLNRAANFVCKDCALFENCGWCPGRSYMETGSLNNCSNYLKIRAEQRHSL